MKKIPKYVWFILLFLLPLVSMANVETATVMSYVTSGYAIAAVIIFLLAYALVMLEDVIHLNKSKPVILAAGFIWVLVAIIGKIHGQSDIVDTNLNKGLLEYGELLLFLLVAMTYINVLEERLVFSALKTKLLQMGLGFKGVFWLTGFLAFFISPFADNLTTALILSAVVLSIGHNNSKFVCLSCVNIVVAANAGGAFSPFGDITTLMVWQDGVVPFGHFFSLFLPALVNFLVPAIVMSFFVPKMLQTVKITDKPEMKTGALIVIFCFIATILTAVLFQNFLGLPPAFGMMTGLGYLMLLNFWMQKAQHKPKYASRKRLEHFDIFQKVQMLEWDTLLFFFGILLAVQGIATLGYLELISNALYKEIPSLLPGVFNHITQANILMGLLSAIVDNIPVMFGVLTMHPPLSELQWLLVTLTTGVGGSLLAIGSAAGVAVMGKAKGQYTFLGHLKWSWVILLGYFASIATHLLINKSFF
ncbi:sodium:proton antiporter NhaD [Facilibium subflavum]|uniref:sodium:proton antiporter NhaD n=1 Tax=Facilibium subflavum TaxID=2219058 RepID=UPI000E653F6E|nr:sodium:proton antiporter NhaD [Facilibium subflavum]